MTGDLTIGIIGTGNVANQLLQKMTKVGLVGSLIYGRNSVKAAELSARFGIKQVRTFQELESVDFILCCTSDDSLAELIPVLSQHAPVVTTSGTVDVMQFSHHFPVGVFYPLQTMAPTKEIDFSNLPIFIESSDPSLQQLLIQLGELFGATVIEMTANQRQYLHIAAVMLNNFTNHLIDLTQDFTKRHDLKFEWFLPLLAETFSKAKFESAFSNQTGPAKRNDQQTIERHLSLLPEDLKSIYQTITNSIIKRHQTND
jgi:predicted short-subunit dehydrogenase-like oxidoreductase (DUF2520 family)